MSYLETICRGQFFIINLDDKTKLSFYPSLPFRTDAEAQFLYKITPFIQFFAL